MEDLALSLLFKYNKDLKKRLRKVELSLYDKVHVPLFVGLNLCEYLLGNYYVLVTEARSV